MFKERFRTNYNIFGSNNNSTTVEEEEESESVGPFNIQMLQTKQESYTVPIRNLSASICMLTETDLSFESTLEQESPFRSIQYTETQEPEQYSSFEVPTNITMDSCVIPEKEKPIEGVMGIPQAPPFSKDAYWPLVSAEPPIVAYKKQGGGSTPGVSPEGRQFMALRKHYEKNIYKGYKFHGAIDLYAKPNDPVIAIEDGEITKFKFFYLGTWGIVVKHRNVTVIYGEVSADSLVFARLAKKIEEFITSSSRPPIPVKAGQVIGRVVQNTSYNRSSMLHVEIFDNNYHRHPPWMKGDRNPHRGLYDPSLALLKLARCGKRGSGSPQTSLPSSSSPSKESIDLMRAVRLNRDYSVKLGWEKYRDKIGALLGFTNNSPTEKVFAEAVANWQKKQGLKPDGIIGPTTWSRIKSEIGKDVSTSRVDSETIGNIDRYYDMINDEATSFPFKKINYIQSEADLSDPRSCKGALFMQVQDAVRQGQTSTAITLAISQGIKDKNLLTDLIFHARHPERRCKRIQSHEQALVKEWSDIKNRLVEPALSSTIYSAPSKPTAGSPLPASPISLRDVAPEHKNALKLMKYLGNILKVPWRLGYIILEHEGGLGFFNHPDGVMQSIDTARKDIIPLIPHQVKILLLGYDPMDPRPKQTLDAELHKQFGSQLAIQIAVGLQELKENLRKFNGYVALTLVGYNSGPGRAYQIITMGKYRSRPSNINSVQWEGMCRMGASLLHQMPTNVNVKQAKYGCDHRLRGSGWYDLLMVYDKPSGIFLYSYQYLRSVRYSIRKQQPAYQCTQVVHKAKKFEEGSGDIETRQSRVGALDKLYYPKKLRGKYFTVAPQELPPIPEDTLPLKAIDHQLYKVKADGSTIPIPLPI